jgi:hypothetical protein
MSANEIGRVAMKRVVVFRPRTPVPPPPDVTPDVMRDATPLDADPGLDVIVDIDLRELTAGRPG